MPKNASRLRILLVRALISVAVFAVLYAVSDLKRAAALVVQASLLPIVAAFALYVLRVPVMAWRWQVILAKIGVSISLGSLTRILYFSAFVGVGLPSANGNDLVRGTMLKRPDIPLSAVVSSILIDRLYGIVSMAFLALPGTIFFFVEGRDSWIMRLVVIGSLALIMTIGLLLALPCVAGKFRLRAFAGEGFFARLTNALVDAAHTFTPGTILACVTLSLASQILAVLAVVCAGIAAHVGEPVAAYLAFVPIVWLLTMLPVTISGLGVREAGFAFLFKTIGSPYAHGVAIGAITSATSIIAAVLGGIYLLIEPRRENGRVHLASGLKPNNATYASHDARAREPFLPPLLVVAGLPRTGTTTIYRNLEQHPGFETPLRKELNHFLHDAPPRTYRDYFPYWKEGKICADVSPFYSIDPDAARRLRGAVPFARVVLLIREPTDWIRSVYIQTRSFVRRLPSFEEFVASPWLPCDGKRMHFSLAGGLYARTISRFAQAFGDQLLVIDFAALESNPVGILREIEQFAGATAYFDDRTVNVRRNNSSEQARSSFPLARSLLQREIVIRAGSAVVPASLLRRVRAWLYYSSSEPRGASPHFAPDPRNLDIVRAATCADREYYAALFHAAPIRCGSQLI